MNEVSRTCFYHLRALRHIRPAITVSDANMIACSVVGSRLDYANSVLYGASSMNINRLQRTQNALARCVLDSKAHRSSDALLHQLHWLPIRYRIDFKLAKLAFLVRSSSTSSYLNSSVARYLPSSGVGWVPKRGGLRNFFRASASLEGHCRRYCELNAEKIFPKNHRKRQKCHLAMILYQRRRFVFNIGGVGNFEAVF